MAITAKIFKHRKLVYFLFGVSAKHLREDVSTTVSQKLTTGSATLISVRLKHIRLEVSLPLNGVENRDRNDDVITLEYLFPSTSCGGRA